MRNLITLAALAALITSAEAQQARPPAAQAKPPAQGAQPQPPAPLPIFPCRTAEEICFLGVVTGKSQIAVLFTNAEKVEGIDEKPIEVLSGDAPGAAGSATPLDLSQHVGRVVMLTGAYEAQAGLTRAELVEVASPLVSTVVKAQLGGEEEPPPPAGKPQPQSQQKPQAPPKR
jgi:hypothetical protein